MLPPIDHPSALTSAAIEDAPFTVAGGRCRVVGSERRGIREIYCDGHRVAGACAVAGAEPISYRITPLGIERTIRVANTTVIETVVAAPHDPAVAIQWRSSEPVEVTIRVQTHDPSQICVPAGQPHQLEPGRMRFRISADTAFHIVVAAPGISELTLDAARWIRLQSAAAQRRDRDLIGVRLPDPALGTAFEWARYRVTVERTEDPAVITALIALGDCRVARVAIERSDDRTFLKLAGRYAAATGDDAFVRAQWPRIEALTEIAGRAGTAALQWLAVAAESIGQNAGAAHMRRLAGHAPTESDVWDDFERGHESAGHAWIAAARRCFEDELGAWPDHDPYNAAALVSSFVFGMLGAVPDAFRMRLRLRPQIPAAWPHLAIDNLRIGDATVSLRMERGPKTDSYAVEQTAGAIPVRLVFEPVLDSPLVGASVDGQIANLIPLRLADRHVAPVQLMLDHERRVELRRA